MWKQIEDVAKLTAAVGGKHVVVIPEMWRDPSTGAVLEDRNLTAEQWRKKTEGMNELGKAMFEKYGVRAQYHPHADSHVDTEENVYRFLDGTDGEFVNLCLDTGHISYCGGDNIAIIERAPGAHRLPAPQAGRPGGARQGRGRGPAVRRGRQARRDDRAAAGNPGHAAAAGRDRAASASTCSRSSSRTCTPARSTLPCPSPSAPAITSGPAASRPSDSVVEEPKAMSDLRVAVLGVGMMGADHVARIDARGSPAPG